MTVLCRRSWHFLIIIYFVALAVAKGKCRFIHSCFWTRLLRKSYYQSGLDWWQSLLPVRKCLGILRLQVAHAHCSQYMRIVDDMAAAHVENGNIIPVYSPLLDRLGLGPRLVGRLGFRSRAGVKCEVRGGKMRGIGAR